MIWNQKLSYGEMAGILVSPRLDSQIRKRSALYKKRNESPKFRDILRERCHARIKASRCALIEKFRNLKDSDELHSTLSGLVKEEIEALTCSKGVYDEIDVSEEPEDFDNDHWLIAEYEKILAEEEANFSSVWEEQVICPLCEMSVLTLHGRTPFCPKCNINFPPIESLGTLKRCLDSALMSHSEHCDAVAYFAIVDDKELSGLFLLCEACFSFSQVV